MTKDESARAGGAAALPARISLRTPLSFVRGRARGFTLLELMIVISIIVILALVVMPIYNQVVLSAREATLKDDLHQMRKMIDQYAADKGKLPQSLEEIVSSGYIREVPTDPITGEKDWVLDFGEDPNTADGGQGITNVRSASGETGSDGTRYSDW